MIDWKFDIENAPRTGPVLLWFDSRYWLTSWSESREWWVSLSTKDHPTAYALLNAPKQIAAAPMLPPGMEGLK